MKMPAHPTPRNAPPATMKPSVNMGTYMTAMIKHDPMKVSEMERVTSIRRAAEGT